MHTRRSDTGCLYQTVFDQAAYPVLLIENEVIVDASRATWFLFGLMPGDDLRGTRFLDLFRSEDHDLINAARNGLTIDSPGVSLETQLVRTGRLELNVELVFKQIAVESKTLTLVTIRDITPQKNLEATLQVVSRAKEYIRRIALVASTMSSPVLISDKHLRIEWVNDAFIEFSGFAFDEVVGKKPEEAFRTRFDETNTELFRRLGDREQDIFEITGVSKTGEPCWLRIDVQRLHGPAGAVIGYMSVVMDITARVMAQQELERSRHFFRSVLDASPASTAVLDENGVILSVNKAWDSFARDNHLDPRFAGVGVNYLTACGISDPSEGTYAAQAAYGLQQVLTGNWDQFEYEYPCHAPDYQRWFHMRVYRFLEDGKIRAVVTHLDITERILAQEALRESEERWRLLVENNPEPILILSEGRIIYSNTAAASSMGVHSSDDLLGLVFEDFIVPEARGILTQRSWAIRQGSPVKPYTYPILTSGGKKRYFEAVGRHVYFRGAQAIQVVARDVTERIQYEEILESNRRRLTALFDNALDAMVLFDTNLRFVDVNPAFCALMGYTRDELFRLFLADVCTIEEDGSRITFWPDLIASGKAYGNNRLRHKDGHVIDIEYRSVAHILPELHLVVLHDISERIQAEEALKKNAENLQTLSLRLVEVQEKERRFLARELHDEVGQMLTGLKLVLEACDKEDIQLRTSSLAEARSLVQQLLARVRELSLDLRPSVLDDLGLVPALLWLFERFYTQTRMSVQFSHSGLADRMTPEIETTVYRIVQEALTNITRHAGVLEADVQIVNSDNVLKVRITDKGTGFDLPTTVAHPDTSGLSGMRERVTLINGNFYVDTDVGKGTTIIAEIPMTNKSRENVR